MFAPLALILAASRQAVVFKDTPNHYTAPVNTSLPVNPDPDGHPKLITESAAAKAKRMKWWEEARFGLFLHWGSYSEAGGVWNGKTNYAEWIRQFAQIPLETYNKFAAEFDPTQFNADAWVKMAKNAGMKYIVITAKHHEGFNMFASKYSEYNIMNSPWHHDPMKDLAAACKKYGLKFCFYYSVMDWHDYNYLPRRSWEESFRPNGSANFQTYAEYLFHEVDQLLTDYGPIGVMWFDGVGEKTWTLPYGIELYNLCRTVQPNTIVNDRTINWRIASIGDFKTPEGKIPAEAPSKYWETCMTMGSHWGYNSHDHSYKSVKTLVQNLVDIASKGGNYLLNIGPTGQGTFPPDAVERLKGIGDWMHVNSSAIYDTTASPYADLGWGKCTVRRHKSGTQLYYEVFDWPSDGELIIPGTKANVKSARLLGGSSLKFRQQGPNLVVTVPKAAPDSVCPVVEVDVEGFPVVFNAAKVSSDTPSFVSDALVTIRRSTGTAVRYTLDGTSPTRASEIYSGPFKVSRTCTVTAAVFNNGRKVTQDSALAFTKVKPAPSILLMDAGPGLQVLKINGAFSSAGDVLAAAPYAKLIQPAPALGADWGTGPTEHVGRVF